MSHAANDVSQSLSRPSWVKRCLIGGICLLSGGLLFEQTDVAGLSRALASQFQPPAQCIQVVQRQATISRATLAKLLVIPEGQSRAQIRQLVKAPYCRLSTVQIRAGENTEREAYPLEFKPDTWLVVTYEGNSYAGFDFLVR